MEQARHIYNPFILKLLHIKAYYLDKLITCNIQSIVNEKHDAMRRFITYNDHVTRIIRDIGDASLLNNESVFPLDIYLVNFEYCLFRIMSQYTNSEGDGVLFPCESMIRSNTTLNGKEVLIRTLCQRHLSRVYFDNHCHQIEEKRKERMSLFYNIKELIEKDFLVNSVLDDSVVYYDNVAVMGMMYIYYINEFISDCTHMYHKKDLTLFKENDISLDGRHGRYIQGETTAIHMGDSTEYQDEDLTFLYQLRDMTMIHVTDYIHSWCIKERPSLLNSDATHTEDRKEMIRRLHNTKYNDYNTLEIPSRKNHPFVDKEYSLFFGYATDSTGPTPSFLSLYGNERYYESILYTMMFNFRLDASHQCNTESTLPCHVCRYKYIDYQIHDFSTQCRIYRYNKSDDHERPRFDYYLHYSVIELVPVFKGMKLRLLYNMQLLLYHTNMITAAATTNNVNMLTVIDIHALIEGIKTREFFHNIDEKLCTLMTSHSHNDCKFKKKEARRLALDMTLLIKIIGCIDRQRESIEKHERTLKKMTSRGEYTVHDKLRNDMKLLYIYYGRQLRSFIA